MSQRDVMEADVVFVGGGPACLTSAIHLARLIEKHNTDNPDKKLDDPVIVVLEKAAPLGNHGLSGAVLDPRALKEFMPDFRDRGCPIEQEVDHDEILFLTESHSFKLPIVPKAMDNHGNLTVSLAKFVRWLGEQASEYEAINLFEGFAGTELLYDGDRVIGVRTNDKGVNKKGEKKGNYEPGADITAKVVVIGEGPRGTLSRELMNRYDLQEGKNPQSFATGVKEIWELPEGAIKGGRVIHTMGYPNTFDTFGGGFIYNMADNRLCVGFVVGLDYNDPFIDPHHQLQRFKAHPAIAKLLEGGKMVQYGAKTIPEGGYWAIPKTVADGAIIIGDSASFLNPLRLKGIHLAMKTGMMAAETIFEGMLKNDLTKGQLETFEGRFKGSWAHKELWGARNTHEYFKKGLLPGMILSGMSMYVPALMPNRLRNKPDATKLRTVEEKYGRSAYRPEPPKFDGKLTFDKLTLIYHSGTIHEEDQPPHLLIADPELCRTRCAEEYANPCTRFCPAAVYEYEADKGLMLNPSNCVHCKTCDIKEPYIGQITWVPPEGGGGPKWTMT